MPRLLMDSDLVDRPFWVFLDRVYLSVLRLLRGALNGSVFRGALAHP